MCKIEKNIISKNSNGELSYCQNCKVFDLTFNNILIELTPKELINFQKLVKNIDVEYWDSHFNRKYVKRNIPIVTCQQNLILIFSFQELLSLKELIFSSKGNKLISSSNFYLSMN